MPDLTKNLEASAAFTKATGVGVGHGYRQLPGRYKDWVRDADDGDGVWMAKDATDRDLSVWAWRQLAAIAKLDYCEIDFTGGGCEITGPTVYDHGESVGAEWFVREDAPEAAVLAATKKIGGLA